MFCDKSNITRLVRALEDEGIVCRRPHESDGRALRLYLTDQGGSFVMAYCVLMSASTTSASVTRWIRRSRVISWAACKSSSGPYNTIPAIGLTRSYPENGDFSYFLLRL